MLFRLLSRAKRRISFSRNRVSGCYAYPSREEKSAWRVSSLKCCHSMRMLDRSNMAETRVSHRYCQPVKRTRGTIGDRLTNIRAKHYTKPDA